MIHRAQSNPTAPLNFPANQTPLSFGPEVTANEAVDNDIASLFNSSQTTQQNTLSFGNYASAGSAASSVSFPEGRGNSRVEEYTQAILNFSENQASPAEARQIAEAAIAASEEFNIDARLLIATMGHESHFDVNANEGNGKGLGQITQPARAELQRISRGGRNGYRARVSPDTNRRLRTADARSLFQQINGSNRNRALLSVTPNVRTTAAYLRVMMDIKGGNVNQALGEYNNHGGEIQRLYPGKVANVYREMWGSAMPSTLR